MSYVFFYFLLFFYLFLKQKIATYKEDKKKPQKTVATSVFQEIDFGSQNTKLNQFFDEMLKKKIEKFSKKLGVLEANNLKRQRTMDVQNEFNASFYEKEIIIPVKETHINVLDIATSTGPDIDNPKEHIPASPSYKVNPKMIPTLLKLPNDSTVDAGTSIRTKSVVNNKIDNNGNTINAIPNLDKKLEDDDQLLETLYGYNADDIHTHINKTVNNTKYNGK